MCLFTGSTGIKAFPNGELLACLRHWLKLPSWAGGTLCVQPRKQGWNTGTLTHKQSRDPGVLCTGLGNLSSLMIAGEAQLRSQLSYEIWPHLPIPNPAKFWLNCINFSVNRTCFIFMQGSGWACCPEPQPRQMNISSSALFLFCWFCLQQTAVSEKPGVRGINCLISCSKNVIVFVVNHSAMKSVNSICTFGSTTPVVLSLLCSLLLVKCSK